MSPKHKLITAVWCSVTMIATLALSHGHLIVREILNHWPASDSWEGRLESALYTQGGLVFVAGLLIGGAILVRGHFVREQEKQDVRKELAQRERHERATALRHDDMINLLSGVVTSQAEEAPSLETVAENSLPKKQRNSGARPR